MAKAPCEINLPWKPPRRSKMKNDNIHPKKLFQPYAKAMYRQRKVKLKNNDEKGEGNDKIVRGPIETAFLMKVTPIKMGYVTYNRTR